MTIGWRGPGEWDPVNTEGLYGEPAHDQFRAVLDADPEVRATRRLRELQEKGQAPPAAEVSREIRERDHRDSTRADSPLTPAADAVRLDTTELSLAQVEQAILEIIGRRLTAG